MNVIAQRVHLLFAADATLPITRLPYTAFVSSASIVRDGRFASACSQIALREAAFDVCPAKRKPVVARRKSPDAVQMIRQQDTCEHVERPPPPDLGERPVQRGAGNRFIENGSSPVRNDREEVSRAFFAPANVVRHAVVSLGSLHIQYVVRPDKMAGRTRPTPSHVPTFARSHVVTLPPSHVPTLLIPAAAAAQRRVSLSSHQPSPPLHCRSAISTLAADC